MRYRLVLASALSFFSTCSTAGLEKDVVSDYEKAALTLSEFAVREDVPLVGRLREDRGRIYLSTIGYGIPSFFRPELEIVTESEALRKSASALWESRASVLVRGTIVREPRTGENLLGIPGEIRVSEIKQLKAPVAGTFKATSPNWMTITFTIEGDEIDESELEEIASSISYLFKKLEMDNPQSIEDCQFRTSKVSRDGGKVKAVVSGQILSAYHLPGVQAYLLEVFPRLMKYASFTSNE